MIHTLQLGQLGRTILAVAAAVVPALFDIVQWTGDGTGTRVIPTSVDLSTGGFVHVIESTGTGANLQLFSADGSTVYRSLATFGDVATVRVASPWAFGNGDFTVSTDSNVTATVYTAWIWRRYAGFCDVVNYPEATLGTLRVINHALGAVPEAILIREHSTSASSAAMMAYFSAVNTLDQFFRMESTGAEGTTTGTWGANPMTTTTFEVDENVSNNGSIAGTGGYFAILFASNAALGSSIGSYVGNGNVSGTVVNTGFAPDLIMVKGNASSRDWAFVDQARTPSFSGNEDVFRSNIPELVTIDAFALNGTTGFQLVTTDADYNNNAATYVYMAFKKS